MGDGPQEGIDLGRWRVSFVDRFSENEIDGREEGALDGSHPAAIRSRKQTDFQISNKIKIPQHEDEQTSLG